MLDRLANLTTDASSAGRRELLNAVTDLFLVDEDPSEAAKDHYADIATHSLGGMNGTDKAHYAERVAAEPTLPNRVARSLAEDEDYAVANLVLRLSPVLTDADLAAIAVTHPQSHLVAIAERASLSESVTDILVERGNQIVLRTVSGNDGAAFSDSGLDRLISRGGADPHIADNLSRRKDSLPKTQARRVLQIAAQMAAKTGPEYRTEIISGEPPKASARQARERRLEVKLLIADLKDGRRTIDNVVTHLVEEDRAFDIATVIANFSDVSSDKILRALMQRESSGIAVACKAIGLTKTGFKSVLQLRAKRLGLAPRTIDADVANYVKLETELSERAMRFLKVKSKVG